MRAPRLVLTLALATATAGLAACDDDDTTAPAPEMFAAQLAGSNEIPPVATTASGSATFVVRGDTAIDYTVNVTGLAGTTMAHLHVGGAGVNGPVAVWLLPPDGTAPQAPGPLVTGVLAAGRIRASSIRPLAAGQAPITLDSLRTLLRTGQIYVNVHTQANGGGELRGQTSRM